MRHHRLETHVSFILLSANDTVIVPEQQAAVKIQTAQTCSTVIANLRKYLPVLPIILELKMRKHRLGSVDFKKTLIDDAFRGRLRASNRTTEPKFYHAE